MQETIYSQKLVAGSKTYFFDIKESKTKEKYLQVTETRLKNGEQIKNSITIFNNQMVAFRTSLEEVAGKF